VKIALIGVGYPGVSGGGAITTLLFLKASQKLGFDTEYINIKPSFTGALDNNKRIFFKKHNIKVTHVTHKQFSNFIFFRNSILTKKLKKKIFNENIKFVFFYGIELCSLVYIQRLNSYNYIILADPPSAVHALSLKIKFINLFLNFSIKFFLKFFIDFFKQGLLLIYFFFVERRVDKFLGGFATANHHAKYYRKYNKKIIYLPAPVISPKKNFNIENIIKNRLKKSIPIFLIIGHNLDGTSNRSGFLKFSEKVKSLEKFARDLDWKIYVVGSNFENYKDLLSNNFLKKRIKILGYKNLEHFHHKIYALLNFIDDPLGNRTRISQCFAYGIPTLTHISATYGTPELKKNSGAILYEDEKSFIRGFRSLIENRSLYKKLSLLSYKTYNKYHSQKKLEYLLKKTLCFKFK